MGEDTLTYRILTHELKRANKNYILEIGKTTSTIGEYNNLLQRFTFYVLIRLDRVEYCGRSYLYQYFDKAAYEDCKDKIAEPKVSF